MPNEISQLQINGTTYNIADATARDSVSQLGLWRDSDGSNVIVSSYNASSDCYDKGIFNGGIIHHYQTSTNEEDEDFSNGIDFGYPGQGIDDINPSVISATSGTGYTTASITFPNPGTGMIYLNGYWVGVSGKMAYGTFQPSSNGTPGSTPSVGQTKGCQLSASSGNAYYIPYSCSLKITPKNDKTGNLWGRQDGGEKKNIRGLIRACQIY